jgi:hypothetical protein
MNMYRPVLCIFLCTTILLYGCTQSNIFQPEHLFNDSSEDITVYTNDSRIIKFMSGDYQASNLDGGIVKGKGKLIIGKSSEEFRAFEGVIGFSEIQNIKITETTGIGKTANIALITFGIILVYFWIFPLKINID